MGVVTLTRVTLVRVVVTLNLVTLRRWRPLVVGPLPLFYVRGARDLIARGRHLHFVAARMLLLLLLQPVTVVALVATRLRHIVESALPHVLPLLDAVVRRDPGVVPWGHHGHVHGVLLREHGGSVGSVVAVLVPWVLLHGRNLLSRMLLLLLLLLLHEAGLVAHGPRLHTVGTVLGHLLVALVLTLPPALPPRGDLGLADVGHLHQWAAAFLLPWHHHLHRLA